MCKLVIWVGLESVWVKSVSGVVSGRDIHTRFFLYISTYRCKTKLNHICSNRSNKI
ncbi:hypothetical protein HanXRQr2_Chr14g0647861 [Helianthus annuus]|uniref:Uncharacterized protein n=1 Tax=Helianthus annuus TaxID=4232 RepID=A0A9K3H8T3_HELAN|nr:hypothetical protein HanXRQr2_Chr14g0647861 [Helianthus annuus]